MNSNHTQIIHLSHPCHFCQSTSKITERAVYISVRDTVPICGETSGDHQALLTHVFILYAVEDEDTHESSAEAEDGLMFLQSVYVSFKETVPKVCGMMLFLSQMNHRVGRSDKSRISRQVQMKPLTERLDPVMSAQFRDVRVSAALSSAVMQPVRDRLSELIQSHWSNDLI